MIEIIHQEMTSTAHTQKAYDGIYSGSGIQMRDSFYMWILKLLKPEPGSRLLDISCGQGRLSSLAHRAGFKGLGMDFSPQALYLANLEAQGYFAVADGQRLPLADHSIDYISHIGSLEHYLNPSVGAKEIGRVLKPHGRAVILLPNTYGLFGNIRFVLKNGDVFDDGQPIQRYATRKHWANILSQGGLRIDRTISYTEVDYPYFWRDVFWLLAHPQKIVRGLIARLLPVNLANQFVYICSSAREKE
jgi:SAM-dependent methyltransferase